MEKNFKSHFLFRFRWVVLTILLTGSGFLVYHALKVEKSYEYFSTLPPNNATIQAFHKFQKTFKENGSHIVIGIENPHFFNLDFFTQYQKLQKQIKQIKGVEQVFSLLDAVLLEKREDSAQFKIVQLFNKSFDSQQSLDSTRQIFKPLKLYQKILYESDAYRMVITLNTAIAQSKERENVIAEIEQLLNSFSEHNKISTYISGMPYIRTKISKLISSELSSLILLSTVLLLLSIWFFYRSFIDVLISLIVVVLGIVWSFGTIHLIGYKLTLLTAIVPTLIIIIGIPNCIYFLNKYHVARQEANKNVAIFKMVMSMGKITLFCNLTMAIGFFVFIFTNSQLLKEFGLIAGLNICLKFILSYTLIPLLLYFFPEHRSQKNTNTFFSMRFINRFHAYIFKYNKTFFIVSALLILICSIGMFQLKSLSFIVDDIPQSNKIITDLKFFEKHFKGVLPIEIILDTKHKNVLFKNLNYLEQINSLSTYLSNYDCFSKPLSIIEGLKFARQAYYYQDPNSYTLPNSFDIGFIAPYLKNKNASSLENMLNKMLDSTKQFVRLSLQMKDLGSQKMDSLIKQMNIDIPNIIDTSKINYEITGGAKTFLEGNVYIMKGLKESILWAILLISVCMIYLFKSFKIIFISLLPNIIPLLISLGFMGFMNIYFQPSTVIIFSIVLGISSDITIRYLVVFKLFFKQNPTESISTLSLQTLQETFSSIIFTAIALIAGFLIFAISRFGAIQALGWLTSFALCIATIYNLVFLPLLLQLFLKK